jgi:hypothetical protein
MGKNPEYRIHEKVIQGCNCPNAVNFMKRKTGKYDQCIKMSRVIGNDYKRMLGKSRLPSDDS